MRWRGWTVASYLAVFSLGAAAHMFAVELLFEPGAPATETPHKKTEPTAAPTASSKVLAAAIPPQIGSTTTKFMIAGADVRLRFGACPLEFLRSPSGEFTEQGRFVAPGSVFQAGRRYVFVVEEWSCKPCKTVIERLSQENLGAGVDLIVLGVGEQYGNHGGAVKALSRGYGWLLIGGFDYEKLLATTFGPDEIRTPSVLITESNGKVLAGLQGATAAETITWVREQLSAGQTAGGRDQSLGSRGKSTDHDPGCEPALVAANDKRKSPPRKAPAVQNGEHVDAGAAEAREALMFKLRQFWDDDDDEVEDVDKVDVDDRDGPVDDDEFNEVKKPDPKRIETKKPDPKTVEPKKPDPKKVQPKKPGPKKFQPKKPDPKKRARTGNR